jgi:uncharacterized membrane protein YccC
VDVEVRVPWEELRALSGWVGLVSLVVLLALIERLRKVFATHEALRETREDLEAALEAESQDRKTADKHGDVRVMDLAQKMHVQMGKLELLQESIHKAEVLRVREVAELRTEVREGFARIEGALRHHHRHDNNRED